MYKYVLGIIFFFFDRPKLKMSISLNRLMDEWWYIHAMECYTAEIEHIKTPSNNVYPLTDIMCNKRKPNTKRV